MANRRRVPPADSISSPICRRVAPLCIHFPYLIGAEAPDSRVDLTEAVRPLSGWPVIGYGDARWMSVCGGGEEVRGVAPLISLDR